MCSVAPHPPGVSAAEHHAEQPNACLLQLQAAVTRIPDVSQVLRRCTKPPQSFTCVASFCLHAA